MTTDLSTLLLSLLPRIRWQATKGDPRVALDLIDQAINAIKEAIVDDHGSHR